MVLVVAVVVAVAAAAAEEEEEEVVVEVRCWRSSPYKTHAPIDGVYMTRSATAKPTTTKILEAGRKGICAEGGGGKGEKEVRESVKGGV
jgi:hypothetical protein